MSGEPASAPSDSVSAQSADSMQQPCQVTAPERLESQDPNPKCGVNAGSTSSTSRRRQPPAAVRQEVFERDGGQCTFVDQQGRRCAQRHFLEFDPIEAFAIGGVETVTNLRLRCRAHNSLEADRLFGQRRVKAAIAHARRSRAR